MGGRLVVAPPDSLLHGVETRTGTGRGRVAGGAHPQREFETGRGGAGGGDAHAGQLRAAQLAQRGACGQRGRAVALLDCVVARFEHLWASAPGA